MKQDTLEGKAKTINWVKGSQKQTYSYKFHRTGKNKHTHEEWINKRKPFAACKETVRHSQK